MPKGAVERLSDPDGRDDGWLYLDRARAELADAVIRFHAAGMRLAGDKCDRILNAVEVLLTQSGREDAPRESSGAS